MRMKRHNIKTAFAALICALLLSNAAALFAANNVQVKEKKVTYELDEWEEVERRARKLKMKTGTYIKRISVDGYLRHDVLRQFSESLVEGVQIR